MVSRQLQAVNWLTCGRSFLSLRLEMEPLAGPGKQGHKGGAARQGPAIKWIILALELFRSSHSSHWAVGTGSDQASGYGSIRESAINNLRSASPTSRLPIPPGPSPAARRLARQTKNPTASHGSDSVRNCRHCSIEGLRALVHLNTECCSLFLLLPPHSIDPPQLARRSRTIAPSLPAPRLFLYPGSSAQTTVPRTQIHPSSWPSPQLGL